jgi:ABC-type sugar transport system ATPase subunit
MTLELIDVSIKSSKRILLNNFSLKINVGEVVLVVGPSGAGKSTLLNFIAGFIPKEKKNRKLVANKWFAGSNTGLFATGKFLYDGKDMTDLLPEERRIGLVNQKHSVYPHLTGIENIAFPMKCDGVNKKNRVIKARELAGKVFLNNENLFQKASELSGGEQQRLAIAKILARKSVLGLLDEPFSHLDPILRRELIELVYSLVKKEKNNNFSTAFIVSHDWNDLKFADRVILIVDSNTHARNVEVLSLKGGFFQPIEKNSVDSDIKKEWINEINKAFAKLYFNLMCLTHLTFTNQV